MMRQQVSTVTSSWECVFEQSQGSLNLGRTKCVTLAISQKVGQRSNSLTNVSWNSPSEVNGKETRSDTRKSIRSENMNRHGQTKGISALTLRRDSKLRS